MLKISKESFKNELRRRAKKKINKIKSKNGFGRVNPPLSIERTYYREIQQYLKTQAEFIDKYLISALPRMIDSYNADRPKKTDSALTDLLAMIARVKREMSQAYSEEEIRRIARRKGISVSEYNAAALKAGIKRVAGVDVFFSEPHLAETLEFFAAQNVTLITSIHEESMKKTFTIINNGFRSGLTAKEIEKDLYSLIDPSVGNVASRAKLIARDQISKLNGQLTELRQTELGINKYTWQTSGDERVRDTHRANDGKVFSWDAPPATGHPGEDFNCRCVAIPYLEDIVSSES